LVEDALRALRRWLVAALQWVAASRHLGASMS